MIGKKVFVTIIHFKVNGYLSFIITIVVSLLKYKYSGFYLDA